MFEVGFEEEVNREDVENLLQSHSCMKNSCNSSNRSFVKKRSTWKEVTVRCLCAAWRPLWPECVLQRDFEGFEELEEEAVVHDIVSLGNSMGLEVDNDELLELHKEQNETLKQSLTSEESGEEEDKEESHIIPAKDLKDVFFCWSKLFKLVEDYHPDVGSVQRAIRSNKQIILLTSRAKQATAQKENLVSTSPHWSPENDPSSFCSPTMNFTTPSTSASSMLSNITNN
ncbi:putative Tigger transposable element-derived protein 1-like 326 [Homarus americanus]|uniref:Putative Tigger transposable element-derived protein 1-like 326 n=1 Tax=Homarus americanus TaxID=6706 RepID=A0A8J5N5E6_HOMAM|nr:putative Tigger transposable element-derived protein 1-like 326 [Homarus americanus]